MIRRTALALLGLLTLLPGVAGGQPDPPPADKYLWLEDQRSPQAIAWARSRYDAAVKQLTASPAYPAVLAELRQRLTQTAPFPTVYLLGDHYVRMVRDAAHPEGLLQTAGFGADRTPTTWRTVLDLGALNRHEHSNYRLGGPGLFAFPDRCLPPAFNRCLLGLSSGGSSSLELREFDLKAGTFVPGGFRTAANRSVTAWLNPDTLLIGHSLDGSPALPSNFPAVLRIWRRGTPLASARPIFQAAPTDSIAEVKAIGDGRARRGVVKAIRDYGTIDYFLVGQDGALSRIDLPRKVKYVGDAALAWPYIAVQLAEPARLGGRRFPAEAIVACDLSRRPADPRRYSAVFTPGEGVYVSQSPEAAGRAVAFVETRNLRKTLILAEPSAGGWRRRPVLSAEPGVALSIVKPDPDSGRLLVKREGFLTPAALDLVAGAAPPVQIAAGQPILDARRFRVDIRSARSRDGTMVDYYLVRPRKPASGPVPTLVSGYGSFGVDFDPDYFASGLREGLASWLDRGGAYAAAAIRGGGERGEAWHLAGAGLNKQNAFDDFIAVGEDLVKSGFTTPAQLGAFGRSGGGLVAAAMVSERPDLYRAVLVGVPVTDVGALSTSGSGIIKGQKSEFGDWDDPVALKTILKYSPYQNLRPGVDYPRVLVLTSTEDNQVGPGQARKFAARLEEYGARPLLIEAPEGGHGVPDTMRQTDLAAAEVTFFLDALMK